MGKVSIRDLRNHGGDVIERVIAGEIVTVTRSGRPVAELRPLRRAALNASALVARWQSVPVVDGADLRRDLDLLITPEI
ncbi:MAG: type II toxin-antitoxin system prevent-host-death family antitoxin [Actinobacteria bacterium]|nr:type II toxin-antitoxin system prevent-host-death family antitoxin [Actinomycetota bacterium]